MRTLKEIVRAARVEERRMSLVQFATAVGLSENTVAAMEYGGRPSLPTLEKLAAFLRRPVSDLSPEHAPLHRRAGPRRRGRAEVGRTQELVGRLTVLHAEFNAAHEHAIAAIRASDAEALRTARQQQADILSRQDALIHRYNVTVAERSDQGGCLTSGSALTA
jgi:transcriptional regulator with XRE-family HTH domain